MKKIEWNPVDSIINTYATYRACKQTSPVPKHIVKWVSYCLTGEYLDKINAVPKDINAKFNEDFNLSVLNGYDFVTGFAYLDFKKKDENKRTTADKDLRAAARSDHDLLYRQIVACAPDAIFCCQKSGQDSLLTKLLVTKVFKATEKTSPGVKITKKAIGLSSARCLTYQIENKERYTLIINWVHPSARGLSEEECRSRLRQLLPEIYKVNEKNRLWRQQDC